MYSTSEVGQVIGKTPTQISRLIKKGYLVATVTENGTVISDEALGDYWLYGQYGRRPPKKDRRKKKKV
jgi:hypothetical protein